MINNELKTMILFYFLMAISASILICTKMHITLNKQIIKNCTYWNISHLVTRIILIIYFKKYWKIIVFLDILWEVMEWWLENAVIFVEKNKIFEVNKYISIKDVYDWNDIIWNIIGMIIGLYIHNKLVYI